MQVNGGKPNLTGSDVMSGIKNNMSMNSPDKVFLQILPSTSDF